VLKTKIKKIVDGNDVDEVVDVVLNPSDKNRMRYWMPTDELVILAEIPTR
jgi:transcriptional regulator